MRMRPVSHPIISAYKALEVARLMPEHGLGVRIFFAGALSLGCLPEAGFAAQQILCTAQGTSDVVITLQAKKQFGRTLDCISGDFIADLTPCAPDGAFGLSAPTGSAALVGIVDRWQDYMNHSGGVTSHFVTADKISFSGGFVYNGEYNDSWTFTINRLTGSGQLQKSDKGSISYTCSKKNRAL